MTVWRAPPRADGGRSARAVRWACVAGVLGGLLSLAAPFVPWWYVTTNTGTPSTAEFYPLGGIYASGGGGGGFTSFAAEGLGPIGTLYVAVAAVALGVAFLAFTVAGLGLARSSGRGVSARAALVARAGLAVALVAGVAAVVAVPLVQPSLFANANPRGTCSIPSSAGSCSSFWGTYHGTGVSTVWGAGAGWWSELLAAALLGGAWVGGIATAVRGSPGRPSGAPAARELRATDAHGSEGLKGR